MADSVEVLFDFLLFIVARNFMDEIFNIIRENLQVYELVFELTN